MLRALRAMYSSVVVSVRVEAGCTTEEFSCPVGLKLSECSSPLLFSFFINELATTIRVLTRFSLFRAWQKFSYCCLQMMWHWCP